MSSEVEATIRALVAAGHAYAVDGSVAIVDCTTNRPAKRMDVGELPPSFWYVIRMDGAGRMRVFHDAGCATRSFRGLAGK